MIAVLESKADWERGEGNRFLEARISSSSRLPPLRSRKTQYQTLNRSRKLDISSPSMQLLTRSFPRHTLLVYKFSRAHEYILPYTDIEYSRFPLVVNREFAALRRI